MRIGEYSVPGGTPIMASVNRAISSAEWQLVTAKYQIVSAPGSTLGIRFRVLGAANGACFDVDDVCLQQLASGCQ
jgi:hypothetical protein